MTRGYISWFQDLVNVLTMPATILKNKVMFRRFQAESGYERSSILTLLGNGVKNLHETYQCRMYSTKFLMMGKEDAQTCRVL